MDEIFSEWWKQLSDKWQSLSGIVCVPDLHTSSINNAGDNILYVAGVLGIGKTEERSNSEESSAMLYRE